MAAKATSHKHTPPVKPALGTTALGGVLGKLAATNKPETKSKSDKPVVNIPELADQFQELQKVNANIKALTGRKEELQAEVYPPIEVQRRAICAAHREYIGSVRVMAGPKAGIGTYFITNRFTGLDAGDAEQVSAAKDVIRETLNCDEQTAVEWLNTNMKAAAEVKFNEAALENPEVLKIIEEHLQGHVTVKVKMVPTKDLAETASYEPEKQAVLDALEGARLVQRYSATLKPAGKTD